MRGSATWQVRGTGAASSALWHASGSIYDGEFKVSRRGIV